MSDRRALVVQSLARTFAMIGAALILALVLVGVANGQAYAASSEKEPNNTAQRATALTLGDQCSATIFDSSDEDWFKVTLPSAGKFTLGFGHTYSVKSGTWEVSLYSSDMSTKLYTDYYYDRSTGTDSFTMGLKAGTYYVKVDRNDSNAIGKTYTLRVDRALVRASISTKATATYTGKSLKPSIKVKAGGVTLKKNRDYTLSYKNNKKVGIATVTIKGKGQYAGATRTCTFKIVPKGTVIKSVKAGKKSFTVKWKKQSKQTSGYQIRYSTSKSMKGAKTLTVSGAKKTTAKAKKLKAKKTYYVQVRTYKQVGGKNYCSEWSQKQKVKTR